MMSRRVATVVVSLAAMLALVLGWTLSVKEVRPPDSPRDYPVTTAPPGVPMDDESAPAPVDEPARTQLETASGEIAAERADDTRGETRAPQVTTVPPPAVIVADFPPYLSSVASGGLPPRFERGCKSPSLLLSEMAEEPRDELWASRVERELEAMLGRHPWGFQVTVGCRATICQVTEVGKITGLDPAAEAEWHRYWGSFFRTFRSSPLASEFATSRFFAGRFSADRTPEPGETPSGYWDIAGFVLTSTGQGTPAEPADCSPFRPPVSESPP